MWTLDPIDGTKGFLRGGQYAVCLALLVDARVELGVIGCPNLPSIPSPSPSSYQSTTSTSSTSDGTSANPGPGGTGVLFIAVRGHGTHQLPLLIPTTPPQPPSATATTSGSLLNMHMPHLALHELSFLESVEKAHAALDTSARVAARLGVRAGSVRMDSQAKYAALVRGDGGGGVYLRLPVAGGGRGGESGGYEEKIWVRFYVFLRILQNSHVGVCLCVLFGLCRTMLADRSLLKKLEESSRIIVGVRSILDWGARLVRIMVWLLRGRRSTLR
jgi:3'(2'), 5'-bisphosphate nucleotidase